MFFNNYNIKSTKNQIKTVAQRLKELYELQIIDSQLDEIATLKGELPMEVTDLEDALQINGNDKMMAELVTFRSRLVKLRRIFNYHKSISQGLSSDQASRSPYVTKDNAHEIIDLQDIFERLFSLSQMHYDICGDLLDGYLSISSHQLNVTMRVLTVITAVFVPLSFLAGLYGMNFDSIPELHWEYGYFILLGVMFTLAVGLIYIFKRKNWM